jgi:putative flippase GtrA
MIQFLIFVLVGVVNTAFDFVLWRGIVKILKSGFGFGHEIVGVFKSIFGKNINEYGIAQFFSYSGAVFLSYALNTIFTFKANGNIFGFIAVNLLNLAFSTFLINKFSRSKYIENQFAKIPFLAKNRQSIIKIGIVFFTMVVSFVGYKYFVYCSAGTSNPCLISSFIK